MACNITKRGDNRWQVRVFLGRDRDTGKQKVHSKTIQGTKKDAQVFLNKVLREREFDNPPWPHWSLEETVVRAIKVARRDATVLRVIPVVLAKNRAVLDYGQLLSLACEYQVKSELGMLLELVSELLGDPSFAAYADRLHDRRRKAWRYYPEARNRFEAELAVCNSHAVARRWHFHSNMSEESYRSLLGKHCPELMHA